MRRTAASAAGSCAPTNRTRYGKPAGLRAGTTWTSDEQGRVRAEHMVVDAWTLEALPQHQTTEAGRNSFVAANGWAALQTAWRTVGVVNVAPGAPVP